MSAHTISTPTSAASTVESSVVEARLVFNGETQVIELIGDNTFTILRAMYLQTTESRWDDIVLELLNGELVKFSVVKFTNTNSTESDSLLVITAELWYTDKNGIPELPAEIKLELPVEILPRV